MSKFKVGDRVAVYSCNTRGVATVRGLSRNPDHGVCIELDRPAAGGTQFVHERQCRLLKKKPRRRIWVPNEKLDQETRLPALKNTTVLKLYTYLNEATGDFSAFTEFVEVRRKKQS